MILTDDIVAEEAEHAVDVDLFNDVPEALHDVLDRLLANAFVAEALNARSSVWQDVWRLNSEARLVDGHAAASFASVGDDIAHAALQALRLAVRNALPAAALPALLTDGSVVHWR